LRKLRLHQDMSLEEVASITLIPVRTLTAIEDGDLKRLPEPVYVQGFIKRYADAIGVVEAEFDEAFPNQSTQVVSYKSPQMNSSNFWDKTDRIAVMTAGGIALGSAIAQLPGAIVGGVLGAGYGWYISFAKQKSVQNS